MSIASPTDDRYVLPALVVGGSESSLGSSTECPSPHYCQMEGACGASIPCGGHRSSPSEQAERVAAQVNQRRYLCHCLRVSENEVRDAVQEGELHTVRQVISACGAGGGCMACHRHIKRVLAEEATQRSTEVVASHVHHASPMAVSQ